MRMRMIANTRCISMQDKIVAKNIQTRLVKQSWMKEKP